MAGVDYIPSVPVSLVPLSVIHPSYDVRRRGHE